jgi:CPA1 family monovalent cation:H+ antiporter
VTFDAFDTAAILIGLATLLGYLNHRFIGLPHTIGLTLMAALASLVLVAIDSLGHWQLLATEASLLQSVDFSDSLLRGMLSFLLFAGALHIKLRNLMQRKWTVGLLVTLGVVLSTLLVGVGFKGVTLFLGLDVSLLWCLVFGALISPTDPVAVIGILRSAGAPPLVEAKIAGESLFNDGVSIVAFVVLLAAATGAEPFSLDHAVQLFLVEAGGGVLLGLVAGDRGFVMIRSVDEHNLEILITLSIVVGGYALAQHLDVSGPIAMAVAGLVIGNLGVARAMSTDTRRHLLGFRSLFDEMLNSILFLVIGMEVVAMAQLMAGLLAIRSCSWLGQSASGSRSVC